MLAQGHDNRRRYCRHRRAAGRDRARVSSAKSPPHPARKIRSRAGTGAFCPGIIGLQDRAGAQAIIDRIAQRAYEIDLDVARPGCRADVIVFITPDSQALAAELRATFRQMMNVYSTNNVHTLGLEAMGRFRHHAAHRALVARHQHHQRRRLRVGRSRATSPQQRQPLVLRAAQSQLGAQARTPRQHQTVAKSAEDPYLWLEDVEGERAFGVGRISRMTIARCRCWKAIRVMPALLNAALEVAQSRDRLPTGQVRGGYLYNFWQDPDHVRGVWRRARSMSYAANAPRWETVLDIDALARTENANWVYQGADCDPTGVRCMISLSNGGLDASTDREFDLRTRQFVDGGFVVPEAKSNTGWLDRDTLLSPPIGAKAR
jgi:hypothetical protein